jgi:hypothetical protein
VRGRRAVTLLGHHRSAVRVHCSEPTVAYQSLTLTAKPSTAARSWWRILNWTANRLESARVPVGRFESYPHPRPALFRHRWQSMRRHGGKVRKLSAGLVQRSGRHRCRIQPTTVRLTRRYERTFVRRGPRGWPIGVSCPRRSVAANRILPLDEWSSCLPRHCDKSEDCQRTSRRTHLWRSG